LVPAPRAGKASSPLIVSAAPMAGA
jgi:hypothetical protein